MHMIFLLLIIGIVIASIVWLVSARMQRAHAPRLPAQRSPGLEVLEEPYAWRDQPRCISAKEA